MKFSYTALSTDNKKLTGVFEAATVDDAKSELHKMGVSIITINEISDEEYAKAEKAETVEQKKEGISTYAFHAMDPNDKEVDGTIDAATDAEALKRLITEYKFDVLKLNKFNASQAEQDAATANLGQLKATLAEEGVKLEKAGGELKKPEDRIDKKIVDEIDQVIRNVKNTIELHSNLFTAQKLDEINTVLGELERIRTSNNIKHVSEVSNNLYKLISAPDAVSEKDMASNTEYLEMIGKLKETSIISKESGLYSKSISIQKVRNLFGQISSKLKQLAKKDIAKEVKESASKKKLKTKDELLEKDLLEEKEEKKTDFSKFFFEVDSFLSWLLCFYIIYFFLVDFAIDKNIGIPAEFALQTLKTPLLVNITLFLIISHFLFRAKNIHFKRNFLGSFFLFIFGYSTFIALVINY